MMRIQLTGEVTVEDDGAVLGEAALPGRQGRVVLACLALRGEPVHRDVLADALWPGRLPTTWERTLSAVVSRLRSVFATAGLDLGIANAFGCYELLRPRDTQLDVEVARAEVEAAESALEIGDLSAAKRSAALAAEIGRRPLLAGEDAEPIETARANLRSITVRALEALGLASLGSADAVVAAKEALELEPFRERSHQLLMRAHAALGNTAEALLAYKACRELLVDELGVDPSAETQALHLTLLRAEEDALLDSLSAEGLLNLPQTSTAFVGRTEVLGQLLDLLSRERLVTLVGPGGVGKTRLAVEAARSRVGAYPDGVRFVDLTAVSAASSIAAHVAMTLGLRGTATPEGIATVLGEQQVLLVVDNCEHVADACAELVSVLLGQTSLPRLLATGRMPLTVDAGVTLEVPPLPEDESIPLFVDRARLVRPGFELSAVNADVVSRVCRDLDGIPLAIELVASQIGRLSVTELAENLAEHLRAELRTGGVARHRTLDTAIDWSYDQLGRKESEAFRRLGIFDGPFCLADAEAICGRDVVAEVDALARRSLLAPENAIDGSRFRMLQTIKAYARRRVEGSDEWDSVVLRHMERFAAVVGELSHSTDPRKLPLLEAVHADASGALARAHARRRAQFIPPLSYGLAGLAMARGQLDEGHDTLVNAIDAAKVAGMSSEMPLLMRLLAVIMQWQGDIEGAGRLFDEALARAEEAGDSWLRAQLLADRASDLFRSDKPDDALAAAEEAAAAAAAFGNDAAAAQANVIIATVYWYRGESDLARTHAEAAWGQADRAGNVSGMTRALDLIASVSESLDEKLRLFERALEVSRENGDRLSEGFTLTMSGLECFEAGEPVVAIDYLQRAVRVTRRHGDRHHALIALEIIGCATADVGDPSVAIRLIAAARTLREGRFETEWHSDMAQFDAALERAKAAAGASAQADWEQGRRLSFDEAVEIAESVAVMTTA